jgi:hypothetical protein
MVIGNLEKRCSGDLKVPDGKKNEKEVPPPELWKYLR